MKIKDFEIGSRTFIIAEVGNNHLGKADLAFKSIEVAAKCGVDAVKFQLFNPDLLVSPDAKVLSHVPDKTHRTQRERFRSMLLSYDTFKKLYNYALELGIIFLVTPFDIESADFLNDFVPAFKIASGDVNNLQFVKHIIQKDKPILVSTGMCNQDEIDRLVEIIPHDNTVILHCIGAYPTPDEQACLSMIPFYMKRYGIFIGYSDHTKDILASISAAVMGAVVIEKHFILDRTLLGGDRSLSLNPEEMTNLVKSIRRLESMIGGTPRCVQECEIYGRRNLRRSAYVKRNFNTEEIITIHDIVWLRPEVENGILFGDFQNGQMFKAKKIIYAEQPLTYENVIKVQ